MHPSGRDLEDLANQAADDALVAILAKLDQFRGDALFATWARRFAALEVPGEIRRRLGHARETPMDGDRWPPDRRRGEGPEELAEAGELAQTLARLIAHELTAHQRKVLIAMTIDEVTGKDLAARLDSTPGAVYKTLHDARGKLAVSLGAQTRSSRRAPSIAPTPRAVPTCPGRERFAGGGGELVEVAQEGDDEREGEEQRHQRAEAGDARAGAVPLSSSSRITTASPQTTTIPVATVRERVRPRSKP